MDTAERRIAVEFNPVEEGRKQLRNARNVRMGSLVAAKKRLSSRGDHGSE